MRLLAAAVFLLAVPAAMAEDDTPTSPTLSLGAVFSNAVDIPPAAMADDRTTTDGLTLRSLLAEPTPIPAEPAPRDNETRLSAPLRWATADPDNRLPFRAPPAEWFRAPQEVLDAAQVRAERPDPMLELMRLHGGKLPPLAQRGFGDQGPTERVRRVTTPFLRITGQGASAEDQAARIEIANATRETPARIVIEPVAPAPVGGEAGEPTPTQPLVLLLPPGTTERLLLPAGSYRFQRFVWSMREVVDGRAQRLLAETFDEQRVAAGASYEAVLSLDDERALRRRLAD